MVQRRENDSEAEAECHGGQQARRPELKFDDIVSFSVRLTPFEWL